MGTWISTKPLRLDVSHERGDDAEITFAHTFGAAANVDEAKLTVRQELDGSLVYQLTLTDDPSQWDFSTDDEGVITILPTNTDGANRGQWFYDVELTHTDGTVQTFQEGRYNLWGDVST